jgi:carbonic anhydrase
MNRRLALQALAGLALCPLCAPKSFAAEAAHWSYAGESGPDRWDKLGTANKLCSTGTQQSPLDISATTAAALPKLDIAWAESAETIVNNGHSIQANFADGGRLAVGRNRYQLVQFHFHRPSEHLIGGKRFPMEAHFVHASSAGALGVIGVMMVTGKPNAVFSKVVATMPKQPGPAFKADPAIDPNGLLPAGRSYYAYAGSLTTPPCSETIAWMLLTDPIEVAEADIAAFARLYPMNARPEQKANRRLVLRSGRPESRISRRATAARRRGPDKPRRACR